eukprot:3257665-Prymnesium_polylepis.1
MEQVCSRATRRGVGGLEEAEDGWSCAAVRRCAKPNVRRDGMLGCGLIGKFASDPGLRVLRVAQIGS